MKYLLPFLLLLMATTGVLSQQRGEVIDYENNLNLTPEGLVDLINQHKQDQSPGALSVIQWLSGIPVGMKTYKVTYYTQDYYDRWVKATGLIMVPSTHFKKSTVVYCHPTTDNRANVPSNLKDIAGAGFVIPLSYAMSGYIVVAPDYIGLGDGDGVHPYINAKTEANAVRDMMVASETVLSQLNTARYAQYFLTGYSQGGHAAMATLRDMVSKYNNQFTFDYAYPGSGPYDMSQSQLNNTIFKRDIFPSSAFLAYILNTCQNTGYNIYNDDPSEVISDEYLALYNERVINDVGGSSWGPKKWQKLFKESFVQEIKTNANSTMIQCVRKEGDVYDFFNQTPITMGFSSLDWTVAPENTFKTQKVQQGYYPWYNLKRYRIKTANFGPLTHVGGAMAHLLASLHQFNKLREGGYFNERARFQSAQSQPKNYSTTIASPHLVSSSIKPRIQNIQSVTHITNAEGISVDTSIDRLEDGAYLIQVRDLNSNTQYIPYAKQAPIILDPTSVLTEQAPSYWTLSLTDLDETIDRIAIYNMQGEQVRELPKNTSLEFSTSNLEKGNYTLEIATPISIYHASLQITDPASPIAAKTSIYPIPMDDSKLLHIIYSTVGGPGDTHIEIHNMEGRSLYKKQSHTNAIEESIDLSTLGKGTYILTIQSPNGLFSQKIVL